METQVIIRRKLGLYASFFLILCFFNQSVLAQPLTTIDSASFQKALAASHSDFDRINYQLKLAEYVIGKPSSSKTQLDKVRVWIENAKKINIPLKSKDAEAHILLEEFYLQQKKGVSAKDTVMLKSIITKLKEGSDKNLLAGAYKAFSGYYNMNNPNEIITKIDHIKTAIGFFKKCRNTFETASVLQDLGELYLNSSNFKLASESFKESLTLYKSIHYAELQRLYDLFGTLYRLQSDYNTALKYELLALKIVEQQKDSTIYPSVILVHLSSIMYSLDKLNQSTDYVKSALVIARRVSDTGWIFMTTVNLAKNYNDIKKPQDALSILDEITATYNEPKDILTKLHLYTSYLRTLVRLNQPGHASVYANKLIKLSESPAISKLDIRHIYDGLMAYYMLTKNYKEASVCLAKQQHIDEESGIPSHIAANLHRWYELDSARHDYKAAFFHLLRHKALRDSIFTEKKSRQIEQLQVQYETQKKEDEIKLKNQDIKILTQHSKLDEIELRDAKLARNLTLAGIVLFILVVIIQYRRYHEKQKINALITDKNTALQKLVNEKEWLLKEVHHRVKNNLHTIICLLESQAAYLEDDALKAVESSQHRVFAMSLIHQRLYQSVDIQTIDMAVYLPEFILYLKESFGEPANIIFQQEIEPITLSVEQAIPVALIVNEAVTNAIKYAFPNNATGTIKIALVTKNEVTRLSIEDTGIGITENIEPDKLSSLGMQLIKGLTDDLKGDIQMLNKNGTQIIVSFKKENYFI